MNAQERRRAARAEKQSAWKNANPLLVGVTAKPACRPILTLNRKPADRVVKAIEDVNPYGQQIISASEHHTAIRNKQLEKLIRKHQKVGNKAGRRIHAIQKKLITSREFC